MAVPGNTQELDSHAMLSVEDLLRGKDRFHARPEVVLQLANPAVIG